MPKLTNEHREMLLQERARLEEVDQAIHRSMPPGGNAAHEHAQKVVSDRLREIKAELGKGD